MVDILSAPTTTTFLHDPDSMNLAPVVSAKRKPLQAAETSYAKAFLQPAWSAIRLPVEGKNISGVTVAQITTSISMGSTPVLSNKLMTARAPM